MGSRRKCLGCRRRCKQRHHLTTLGDMSPILLRVMPCNAMTVMPCNQCHEFHAMPCQNQVSQSFQTFEAPTQHAYASMTTPRAPNDGSDPFPTGCKPPRLLGIIWGGRYGIMAATLKTLWLKLLITCLSSNRTVSPNDWHHTLKCS